MAKEFETMFCPHCGKGKSRVVDKTNYSDRIYRRRECLNCKGRFSTHEIVVVLPQRRDSGRLDKVCDKQL